MEEGCGETIYVVGMGTGEVIFPDVNGLFRVLINSWCLCLSDGGDYGLDERDMEASVATVQSLCEQVDGDLILLRERMETAGHVRDYLIRRRVGEADFLEVRLEEVCKERVLKKKLFFSLKSCLHILAPEWRS